MVFFGWMILVILSLWVSVVAFVWALRSGQFAEQGRARYLPLAGELPPPSAKNPGRFTVEIYALLFIGVLGLLVIITPIILSFYRM
jgi:cbb3-type cytochrome oxidase maturation protein